MAIGFPPKTDSYRRVLIFDSQFGTFSIEGDNSSRAVLANKFGSGDGTMAMMNEFLRRLDEDGVRVISIEVGPVR